MEKHIGTLLPGEQVITLLLNLLHVSDSSGSEYNYVSSSIMPYDDIMWCCCMTFYCVVFFYIHKKITSKEGIVPDEWNEGYWPLIPRN